MAEQEQAEEGRGQGPGNLKQAGKRRFALRIVTRRALIRIGVLGAVLVILCFLAYLMMIRMPGKTYSGPLPELTEQQKTLREELVHDVQKLAGEIGERNVWNPENLAAAADFLQASLVQAGLQVRRQNFEVQGLTCCNIEGQIKGTTKPDEIVVVGAHYDTVPGSPGANDNGSGVAAVLALARRFAGKECRRTVRFVLFVNEEPPFFQTEQMGSLVYAKSCRVKAEEIVAMLSLETIGYYTNEPKSQGYPFPFSMVYPSTGNFIGFVSDLSSRELLHKAIASFRANCKFPSEGGAIPQFVAGITWSDHWAFSDQGYPAIMLTDTAPFRYPHYHSEDDTADMIDYESLARVVSGIEAVIGDLATSTLSF